MNPPVAIIKVGDTVRFRRGLGWLEGTVVKIGNTTAHIVSGDDFLGYETFVESLKILKSTQVEEQNDGNE